MIFKEWPSIERFKGSNVIVTLKLDGTNAHIAIFPDETGKIVVLAGKRTSYCTLEQDNFGFAAFVKEHEEELIAKLGHGRHYGEWCGPGIQKCTWLKEKKLFLFDTNKANAVLPEYLGVVPLLYAGAYNQATIDNITGQLQKIGHPLLGNSKPEGVVLYFPELRSTKKIVFENESKPVVVKSGQIDYNTIALSFLQPLRLSKLLSKDEAYTRDFPSNLVTLTGKYIEDLQQEHTDMTEDQIRAVKKSVYAFIRNEMNNK